MTERSINMLVGKIQELESHLSTARSRESAYREALEEIALYGNVVSPTGSMVRSIVSIARAALDRGQEEPVGREVTREELARIIHDTWDIEYVSHQSCEDIADHILKTFRVERQ